MNVFCNPAMLKATEQSRITLRFIQATAMRSTSAGGSVVLVTFISLLKDKFIRNEFVLRSRPEGQITGT